MVTIRDSERLSIVLLILSWSIKTLIESDHRASPCDRERVLIGHGLNCYAIELVSDSLSLQIKNVFKLTCQRKCIIMTHSCLWQINKLVKSNWKTIGFDSYTTEELWSQRATLSAVKVPEPKSPFSYSRKPSSFRIMFAYRHAVTVHWRTVYM